MRIVTRELRTLETQVHLPSRGVPVKSKQKLQVNLASKAEDPSDGETSEDEPEPVPPTATQPKKSFRSRLRPKRSTKSVSTAAVTQKNRWACPMKGHEGHLITDCAEFFKIPAKERRDAMAFKSCFTCFAVDEGCRGGKCANQQSVPRELTCGGCVAKANKGYAPLNLLLCGTPAHSKPSAANLAISLQKWIPNLDIGKLGVTVRINLLALPIRSTNAQVNFSSRTGPPSCQFPKSCINPSTGKVRNMTREEQHNVKKPSKDHAMFIMQTLRIGSKDVLTLYDSGANANLIEGGLAEEMKLTVVDNRSITVNVMGGGTVSSEYGTYSCVFGPDNEGELQELDCQGIERITNDYPKIDLKPIWREADAAMGSKQNWPMSVGGARVQMLIGIRSTSLFPKLVMTLPNGLAIYKSALRDKFGSNLCFGGPHPIFTKAYERHGLGMNHFSIILTQIAQSARETPWTGYFAGSLDSHGPSECDGHNAPVASPKLVTCGGLPNSCLERLEMEDRGDDLLSLDPTLSPASDKQPITPVDQSLLIVDAPSPQMSEEACNHVSSCLLPDTCLKALIPLSKLKGLTDEQDISAVMENRCES